MTKIFLLTTAVIVLTYIISAAQISDADFTSNAESASGSFPLISNVHLSILTDANDAKVVSIAAGLFAEDLLKVGGMQPVKVSELKDTADYIVIIGTIHESKFIQKLTDSGKLDVSEIENQWESSLITVIENPYPDVKKALVIAGSDRRGTAYGVMDLLKQIGVSPWQWWADVTPEGKGRLFLKRGTYKSGPPAIKYRGIFINDEHFTMQPWSYKTFEPGRYIGPETYKKVFELMLRLKANYIWPAMNYGTTPFYFYPENKKVADDYAIIMGTSHIEPLGRNNFYGGDGGEWEIWLDENNIQGETDRLWDWQRNPQNMLNYWEERLIEMVPYDNLYTVGLRGLRDGPMSVEGDISEQVEVLEDVIGTQRELLSRWFDKPIDEIPQVFTPYKEVLEIYDKGNLQIPDDVTIIWPNDNYGYIRRFDLPGEARRKGGTGVYYHVSYLGRPHDYLWLGTTHPSLMRNEMNKAWENGSDKLWLLNVGEIKPREFLTEYFLDMAWNPEAFSDPETVKPYLKKWLRYNVDEQYAEEINDIMWSFYNLAFERRPEFMDWDRRSYHHIKDQQTEYNHAYYNDQGALRLERYDFLLQKVETLWVKIPSERKDAFYQLVYYPVAASTYMNRKWLYFDKARLYEAQGRASARDYERKSQAAYDSIAAHTDYYNNFMSDGKWQHMMSMNPRNRPVFQEPVFPEYPIPDSPEWGIVPEGSQDETGITRSEYRLPDIPLYADRRFFVDLFQIGLKDVSWDITPSDDWIQISRTQGTLSYYGKKEERIWVSVDRERVPATERLQGYLTVTGGEREYRVEVEAFQPDLSELQDLSGAIEINGLVVEYAENYVNRRDRDGLNWDDIPGLGHTGSSIQSNPRTRLSPADTTRLTREAGYVEYEMYTFSSGRGTLYVTGLPMHPMNPEYSLRIGIGINGESPVIRDFRVELRGDGLDDMEWSFNVMSNTAVVEVPVELVQPGRQTIQIYAIDPGVVLDWLTLDLGGLQPGYGLLPDTRLKND